MNIFQLFLQKLLKVLPKLWSPVSQLARKWLFIRGWTFRQHIGQLQEVLLIHVFICLSCTYSGWISRVNSYSTTGLFTEDSDRSDKERQWPFWNCQIKHMEASTPFPSPHPISWPRLPESQPFLSDLPASFGWLQNSVILNLKHVGYQLA